MKMIILAVLADSGEGIWRRYHELEKCGLF